MRVILHAIPQSSRTYFWGNIKFDFPSWWKMCINRGAVCKLFSYCSYVCSFLDMRGVFLILHTVRGRSIRNRLDFILFLFFYSVKQYVGSKSHGDMCEAERIISLTECSCCPATVQQVSSQWTVTTTLVTHILFCGGEMSAARCFWAREARAPDSGEQLIPKCPKATPYRLISIILAVWFNLHSISKSTNVHYNLNRWEAGCFDCF